MIKWKHKLGGNCPVQAEGYFMDYYFYFRARGNSVTMEFSKTEAGWDNNLIHAHYVLLDMEDNYAAGWLPKWVCWLLVWKGCIKFMFKRNKDKVIY